MEKKLSKKFIQKQRDRLIKEREKLISQIATLKKDDPFADPDHASDNAAVDTDVREQIGHETIQAEIDDLEKRIREIDKALMKINKSGSYGICELCREPIPIARLEILPEAAYCVDCEKKLRK
ncbi:MAG: TraR/DksA C4-type zinc finger protein [Patescibacteria group bacterium]|nr:TraR/DksA C4-type zinc finger protein [Patescibacteria group bacterium]